MNKLEPNTPRAHALAAAPALLSLLVVATGVYAPAPAAPDRHTDRGVPSCERHGDGAADRTTGRRGIDGAPCTVHAATQGQGHPASPGRRPCPEGRRHAV